MGSYRCGTAARGELGAGREGERRSSGKVEGDVEMLSTCLPWCGAAYRRRSVSGCSILILLYEEEAKGAPPGKSRGRAGARTRSMQPSTFSSRSHNARQRCRLASDHASAQ
ncbi:unnamed protein product [Urochloa humidicola]